MNPTEQIQIVTFNLAGLEPEDYVAHCERSRTALCRTSRPAGEDLASAPRDEHLRRRLRLGGT